jgi:hypothetical protein
MSTIFCLLNCFNNYEIVAGKIVEFYIQNAINALNPSMKNEIQTYYNSTPFILYSLFFLPNSTVPLPPKLCRSKQLTDFVMLLALTSVTLARINNADVTVFAHQGVVLNTGFSTMYTIANQLNKKTVYWTNDLRNIWGTTDDPLFIGMAPLPYKYLWTAGEKQDQPDEFKSQPKGLNGTKTFPNLAKEQNLCPVVDLQKFTDNWNSFIELLKRSVSVQSQTSGTVTNSRLHNLIELGNKIINYVELEKEKNLGLGWNPYVNKTLYLDIEYVISKNLCLLYEQESLFFKHNTMPCAKNPEIPFAPAYLMKVPFHNMKYHPNTNDFNSSAQQVFKAMALGFSKMIK